MTQSHLRQFSARGKHWPCCTKPRWDSEGNDALLELPVLQRDEPALEELEMGCEGWSRRWRASLRQRALVAWLSRDTVALSKPTGRKGVYAAMEKSYWREQIGTDRPSITWKPRAVTGRKFWSSLCTAGGGGRTYPVLLQLHFGVCLTGLLPAVMGDQSPSAQLGMLTAGVLMVISQARSTRTLASWRSVTLPGARFC